ncbi:hypothetical protein PC118_g12962 [Phytophthora cactorum]|uniref:Uncharacterized protein n=1 Tax=Phytophthora cactorum TaxID=29920 RepID=A0A8T1FPM4_9STRA|nr:hypothetical protein PC118_g12962 [Phytophthora cactorum]
MALTDVILAPYAAAKDAAQSMNPVMLAALVAVVVVTPLFPPSTLKTRVPRPETEDEGNDSNAQRRGPKAHVLFCFAFP